MGKFIKSPYVIATLLVLALVYIQPTSYDKGAFGFISMCLFFFALFRYWRQHRVDIANSAVTKSLPELAAILAAKNQDEIPEVAIEIEPYQHKSHQTNIVLIYALCLWLFLSWQLGAIDLSFSKSSVTLWTILTTLGGLALHWYRQDKKNAHLVCEPRHFIFNKSYFCYDDSVNQHKVYWQDFDEIFYTNEGRIINITTKQKEALSLALADFTKTDINQFYEPIHHYYFIMMKNRPQLKIR